MRILEKPQGVSDRARFGDAEGGHAEASYEVGGSRADVVAVSGRAVSVELRGHFGPTWMAGLCAGLAARSISVQQARATRNAQGMWQATFQLQFPPDTHGAESIPYVELAHAAPQLDQGGLELERYQLSDSADHGGSLLLTLEAHDSLGLLGRVLSRLAMLALFPIAMHIDTRADCAHDMLWLTTVGGAQPSAQVRASLERVLSASLRQRDAQLASARRKE